MENAIPIAENLATEKNWASSRVGEIAASFAVSVAASPLNEVFCVAAATYALKNGGSPIEAATAFAGTRLLIEETGAIAVSDLLATKRAGEAVKKVNARLDKTGASKLMRTNLPTEIGVSFFGGSAIITALKHRQDPERTRSQNRQYGSTFAAGITVLSFAESYAVAAGIEHPSPVTIGLGAVALGGIFGALKWAKNRINQENKQTEGNQTENYRQSNGPVSPQQLGLSKEDIKDVLEDSRTVYVEEDGKKVPVLVPIDKLYWYNEEYLSDHFGTKDIYYYAHPDLQSDDKFSTAHEEVTKLAEKGGVIIYDTVTTDGKVYGDLDAEMQKSNIPHQKVQITKDGRQRFLYQYDGNFEARRGHSDEFKKTLTVYEAYKRAIADGGISPNDENGPALAEVIDGEEAEKLWSIYKKPFERLSDEHPINSGYHKDEFLDILRDPEAVKAVYRESGEITTLALFVNNLAYCTWLNADYYKSKYPEAVETGNHFIFPGIVTDELKRGASYSIPLIQLIAKVQSLRETPAIISFECTDISYKYVPRIVRFAIAKSGVAKTKGLKKPISRFDYYAIKK